MALPWSSFCTPAMTMGGAGNFSVRGLNDASWGSATGSGRRPGGGQTAALAPKEAVVQRGCRGCMQFSADVRDID